MDYKKWLEGLNLAKKLNFTDEQYEEAKKRIKSPESANQILVALLNVSRDLGGGPSAANPAGASHQQHVTHGPEGANWPLGKQEKLSSDSSRTSSCYSSTTSFPASASASASASSSSSSSNPSLESLQQPAGLRRIYIDGSNVARSHGRNGTFSWPGIQICVNWFASRGHSVKVFVPEDRCQQMSESAHNHLRDTLIRTPDGCNDDMFVIQAAKHNNGVIVSNDLFRDEKRLNEDLQMFVLNNRLPYVFVDDLFIPASDPRGRLGPHLDEFLSESSSTQQSLRRSKSNLRFQKNCLISMDYRQRQQVHKTSSVVYPVVRENQCQGSRGPRRALCSTKSHDI